MTLLFDTLFINANLATMDDKIRAPYGAIKNAALGVKNGRIIWLGKAGDLPKHKTGKQHDCGGGWITPGLIDCHSHLVFGGDRSLEFEMRLNGVSYSDIAKAGGGIISTVTMTRSATQAELLQSASARLVNMMSGGLTTIEIKSGYGLDLENERKMLQVAALLGEKFDARVQKTFLGAHAVPPEYAGRPDDYIDAVCEMMVVLANENLIDAVDGFCENIGFTKEQIRRVFGIARDLGLPIKLHAEQLSNQEGAKLAAEFGALSADHLEYIDENGIKAMAKAQTIAVLLPGAFYFLHERQKPPIEMFRNLGVPMALATDCNPGSSPITSLPLTMNMACTLFGLTPEEALAGITREGAKALGMGAEIGTLELGKMADLAIWDIDNPATLSYWVGGEFWPIRVFEGKICA